MRIAAIRGAASRRGRRIRPGAVGSRSAAVTEEPEVRGRDRHHGPRRRRRITLAYSDDEFADVTAAARLAGLTPTGYVADAALSASRALDAPSLAPARAALREIMLARTQVRRFATNVNQATRQLNATGEAPVWLRHAVQLSVGTVERLDVVAAALLRDLR